MEATRKTNSFLVLNNVRSAFNVGSCFRICDSLGINLILQGITPYPLVKNDTRLPYVAVNTTNKIKKTATESINNVNFKYLKNPKQVLSFISKNNLNLYVLENSPKNSVNLYNKQLKIEKPFTLVVGNEITGVEDYYIANAKKVLKLPMYGKNKSLNVFVASAVALYSIIHQK